MATFIQAVALVISLLIMILVAKWQVDDDIKKMQKKFDKVRKDRYDEKHRAQTRKEHRNEQNRAKSLLPHHP